ncbi:MAG: hypothetical protein K2G91_08285 [Prevotella sp.]|nr:hypothetical protein [Prevotella sp.]MDE6012716.1 hypothetical protein [Prevotella sp.]
MRKYSREQVKAMSQTEYESLICKELNEAGFKQKYDGELCEYEPDESTFGGGIVFDVRAVDYLKRLGLVDNGKCPMCGVKEDELDRRLEHMKSGATYHVCNSCYKQYARQEREKRGCACCLSMLIVFALIIWGIVKLIELCI